MCLPASSVLDGIYSMLEYSNVSLSAWVFGSICIYLLFCALVQPAWAHVMTQAEWRIVTIYAAHINDNTVHTGPASHNDCIGGQLNERLLLWQPSGIFLYSTVIILILHVVLENKIRRRWRWWCRCIQCAVNYQQQPTLNDKTTRASNSCPQPIP